MKRDVGDILSYHEGLNLSPFYLGLAGCVSFGISFAFLFVLCIIVPTMGFYWIFYEIKKNPLNLGLIHVYIMSI